MYRYAAVTFPHYDKMSAFIAFIPLPDSSVIKFAPFAFTSPDYYLEREETESVIDSYEQYFISSGDSEFKV